MRHVRRREGRSDGGAVVSGLDSLGGLDLSRRGVVPQDQRIVAPSQVNVLAGSFGSPTGVCALQLIDLVKLHVYWVPMTPKMVSDLVRELIKYEPEWADPTATEGNNT